MNTLNLKLSILALGSNVSKTGKLDGDNLNLAIGAILLAVLALSFGDAVIKRMSVSFTLWQIYLLRSCLALPVLFPILILRQRKITLWPLNPGWVMLRSPHLPYSFLMTTGLIISRAARGPIQPTF